MSRMHSSRKGKASSHKPHVSESPRWVQAQKKEVEEAVTGMGKMGKRAAQIGLSLRDQYGVPDVHLLTGKSINQILNEASVRMPLPEDLAALIERAKNVAKHLGENRKDESSRRGLQLIESKIRRLSKYYIREGIIPSDWKYSSEETRKS